MPPLNATSPAGFLDALPTAALTLDEDAVVVAVNALWRQTPATLFGNVETIEPGLNLLTDLQSRPASDGDRAQALVRGLISVTSGAAGEFQHRFTQPVPEHGHAHWLQVEMRPYTEVGGRRHILLTLRDVTSEHEASQALIESEARYRAASEAGMDGFFIFDSVRDASGEIVDFEFTDLNESGAEMVSRRRDEVIGRKLCELLPVNRCDMFFGAYKKVVETGESLSREFPIDAAEDGIAAQWMEQQVVRVGDGIAISARDISKRKNSELEIQRQREENQTILDAIPALVFYKDTQNNILRVNRAACEAAGLPAEKIEGRHSAELFPETAEAFYRDDLEVLGSGKPKLGYLEKLPGVEGTKDRWVRTDKVPLYDNDRQPAGVIVIAMDVTELKQTSEKLRESEQRYRGLFDRVPVGVIEHDLSSLGETFDRLRDKGVEDFNAYLEAHPELLPEAMGQTQITSVNQAASQLFEAPNHDHVIDAIRTGKIRPEPAALMFKLSMIWNRQVSGEIETRYRTLGGRTIDVLLRIVIPEVDGRPDLRRVLLALTDISTNRQRMFAQAQVTHAERERRMLGHELHDTLAQQLTGINMLTESLRRKLASRNVPEAERVAELAGMVGQANSEVRRLISGLSAEPIAADQIEAALESLAESTTLVHRVPTTFVCPRAPDELSDEAANHLLFIAQEAAHNAAKHAQPSKVQITLDQSETTLNLIVRDDGLGLPPEGQRTTDPDSGLGINIMKYRAQAIGANINIGPAGGQGTAMICSLPTAPETDLPIPSETSETETEL